MTFISSFRVFALRSNHAVHLYILAIMTVTFWVGCEQRKSSPPGAPTTTSDSEIESDDETGLTDGAEQEVTVLGFAYHYYHDNFHQGPSTIADLEKGNIKSEKMKELHADEYEVNPNLEFKKLGQKMSTTWLVRRKDAASKGGFVFMADGTVKKMSADEIKKLE